MSTPVTASVPNTSSITVDACAQIVEAATKSCVAAPVLPQSTITQPNWDAMANSFAGLSNAIAWGGLILTVILFFAGLGWGKVIMRNAEKEARDEARQCMAQWIAENAASEVRLAVDKIIGSSLNGNGANRVDDFGEQE